MKTIQVCNVTHNVHLQISLPKKVKCFIDYLIHQPEQMYYIV